MDANSVSAHFKGLSNVTIRLTVSFTKKPGALNAPLHEYIACDPETGKALGRLCTLLYCTVQPSLGGFRHALRWGGSARSHIIEATVRDLLWLFLFDAVHHRGQLSVYIRPMGGKVPLIYGPSADAPLAQAGAKTVA